MAQRMSRGIVALSAAAISAVYLAGYGATQQAAASLESGDVAAPPPAVSAPAPRAVAPNSAPQPFIIEPRRGDRGFDERDRRAPRFQVAPQPTPAPPASGNAAPSSQSYKDGTYQGSGNSPRGGFQVQVTVSGGRITDVKFLRVTTEYPVSWINQLPGQVISRQSAQVDRVSGATYSTRAFQQAVQQAIGQAQA